MATNLFANVPAAVVAKQTISFSAAGFNGSNTRIIYRVGNPSVSWMPGREINGITGFEEGEGYYLIPTQNMDKETYIIPPISGTLPQLGTPGSFTATAAGATQINLSWSAVSSATAYVVDRATNVGFTTGVALAIFSGSGTSYSDTGRTASTQYFYRVRATASGYTDSAYATSNATTAASGGSSEQIVWNQLVQATAPGSGDLVASSSTQPAGGTATKKFGTVDGNYVQMTVPTTITDSNASVLTLSANNDADYAWTTPGQTIIAGIYVISPNLIYTTTGSTTGAGTPGNTTITCSAGDIIRMEKSGNNVLVKHSTNGGSSFTTIHTHTGVLSGASNVFVKGILVNPVAGRIINNAEGAGLLTI